MRNKNNSSDTWKYEKLGNLCDQIRGVSYGHEDCSANPKEGYIPIYRAHNIQDNGLNDNNLIYISQQRISEQQYIKNGDIVICASSGSKDLVGKASQAKKDLQYAFGAFCKVIRPKTINKDYIGLYFKSNEYRQSVSKISVGSNINNLRNEDINSLVIPLPPLAEQKRIANIVETRFKVVEKAKQAAEEQLKAAKALMKAYLREVFEFDELPEGWENKPVADFCSLMTGGTPSSNVHAYYENGNIPWLVSGDIHKIKITASEKYITEAGVKNSNAKILPKDSVLIALNGQGKTRGTVALLKMEGATCNQSIVAIIPDQNIILPEYIYYNLHSRYYEIRALTGDNERSGLSITRIKDINIPYPFSIKKQKIITEKLNIHCSSIENLKNKLSEQLSYINALPTAILRKAFNGEL